MDKVHIAYFLSPPYIWTWVGSISCHVFDSWYSYSRLLCYQLDNGSFSNHLLFETFVQRASFIFAHALYAWILHSLFTLLCLITAYITTRYRPIMLWFNLAPALVKVKIGNSKARMGNSELRSLWIPTSLRFRFYNKKNIAFWIISYNTNMSLLSRILHFKDNVRFIIRLLIYSFLICKVATFNPIHFVKDVFGYEHCGSIWIQRDIYGNYMGVGSAWKLGEQGVAGAMASAWSASL